MYLVAVERLILLYESLSQTIWYGTHRTLTTTFTTYSQTFTTNPVTGNAWTVDEVNDLDIGVGLYVWSDTTSKNSRCSQVYAIITWSSAAPPNYVVDLSKTFTFGFTHSTQTTSLEIS